MLSSQQNIFSIHLEFLDFCDVVKQYDEPNVSCLYTFKPQLSMLDILSYYWFSLICSFKIMCLYISHIWSVDDVENCCVCVCVFEAQASHQFKNMLSEVSFVNIILSLLPIQTMSFSVMLIYCVIIHSCRFMSALMQIQ